MSAAAVVPQTRRTGGRTQPLQPARQARRCGGPARAKRRSERMTQVRLVSSAPWRIQTRLPCGVHAGHERLQQRHVWGLQPLQRPSHHWASGAHVSTVACVFTSRRRRRASAPSNSSTRRVTRSTFSTHCDRRHAKRARPLSSAQRRPNRRTHARKSGCLTFTASPGATSVSRSSGCSRLSSSRVQQTPAPCLERGG